MTIRFFSAGGRALLASVHAAPRLRTRSAAVLLCNPFGEEAVRAHRAYRVLARRLGDAGYAAMRFDFSGTGDSAGDASDFGIDDWLDDVAAAAGELRQMSGNPRIVLVGLRLGATLAALCARQRADLRAAHLVLWDPVVDGAAYLHGLGQAHRDYLRAELGLPRQPAATEPPTEALGTPLSPRLRAELAAIDLGRDAPRAGIATVLCTQRTADMEKLRAAWRHVPHVRWIDLEGSSAWNSDAALNSAIVPMNEILAVISRIEGCHP